MSDLAAFLLARIAEDQQIASQAAEQCVKVNPPHEPFWPLPSSVATLRSDDRFPVAATLVETYSPARVLAECEAKRRIVELHARTAPFVGMPAFCGRCVPSEYVPGVPIGREPWPCTTIRLLAVPYADHPDYREEEWRP